MLSGASADPSKFGNKILKCLLAHGKTVIPINKKESSIEGVACIGSISNISKESLPSVGLSIVTPPNVTRMILEEGFQLGIKDYMLQPGTLDNNCREYIEQIMLKDKQCNVIESCILVELGE